MSILFAIGVLLLVLAVVYWRRHKMAKIEATKAMDPAVEEPQAAPALETPSGYCFHLGHTWMAQQSAAAVRVGIDGFAAHLLGEVEKIAVMGEQRWVRQGQKLMTLTSQGEKVEMVSPVEGVVTAINPEVSKNPGLVASDPYRSGWVCAVKTPEMESNLRNLVPASLAADWMQNSLARLKSMLAQLDPSLAQDGGLPLRGLLGRLGSDRRRQVVKEFFLS